MKMDTPHGIRDVRLSPFEIRDADGDYLTVIFVEVYDYCGEEMLTPASSEFVENVKRIFLEEE